MEKRSLGLCAFLIAIFLAIPLRGAIVSLTAEGVISETFAKGSDFGRVGESFKLSISYRSDLSDADPTAYFGQYFDDDMVVTLEFLESGQVLRGTGGSVNVNSILGPDGTTFVPEILILSGLPDLGALFFGFRDEDGLEIRDTELPTEFNDVTDYDFVGFSVIDLSPRIGGTRPIPPLIEGNVTLVTVPEPSSLLLTVLSAGFLICLRRRS